MLGPGNPVRIGSYTSKLHWDQSFDVTVLLKRVSFFSEDNGRKRLLFRKTRSDCIIFSSNQCGIKWDGVS